MIGTLVGTTLRRASAAATAGVKTAITHPYQYGKKGVVAVGKGGFAAYTVGSVASEDAADNGWGYGVVHGAMYLANGPLMLGMIGYDISKAALEFGNESYQRHRKLEMFSPAPDLYGNTATMRQRSLQTLDRGRSVLGNEAKMLR